MNEEKHFEKHAVLKTADGLKINFDPFLVVVSEACKHYFSEVGVIFDMLAAKRGLPQFERNKENKVMTDLKTYAKILGIDGVCPEVELQHMYKVSKAWWISLRAVVYMWGYYRMDYYKLYELRRLADTLAELRWIVNGSRAKGKDVFSNIKAEEIAEEGQKEQEA